MAGDDPIELTVDVTGVAPAGAKTIVADLFWPPAGQPRVLVCCLPGGGMTRRYFDVTAPDIEGYSMARHLADAWGLAVLTIDHIGIGESDQPTDGYDLTPAVIADVNDHVVRTVLGRVAVGDMPGGPGRSLGLVPVGLGHSMGGLLAVHQQARHRTYAALALLGFAGGGLRSALTDEELGFADDPDGLAVALPALVASRFRGPLPRGRDGQLRLSHRRGLRAVGAPGAGPDPRRPAGPRRPDVDGPRLDRAGLGRHRCAGVLRGGRARHHR